jgi:hypothetical protein
MPDSVLELALINSEINGAVTYTKAGQDAIEICAVPLLYNLFTRVDVREGDYGISHPDFLRKVKERLLYLASKHNMTDILENLTAGPTITSKSVW